MPSATLLHNVGTNVTSVGPFVPAGDFLYFPVVAPESQSAPVNELWVSNGTALGTRQIYSTASETPIDFDLTAVGTTMYFVANDSTGHAQLFSTSGAGTPTKITVGTATAPLPQDLTAVGNTLYFEAVDGSGEAQLWSYGGSGAATEIKVGSATQPSPSDLTAVGSTLYFLAADSTSDTLVWSYNTTTPATAPAEVGGGYSAPADLAAVGTTLYFAATDSSASSQLWQTTGGAATEITVGTATSPGPNALTAVGSTLYFSAQDTTNTQQFWSYTGSGSPTEIGIGSFTNPGDITAAGSTVYFTAQNGNANGLFSYSSGATATQVTLSSADNPNIANLAAIGNTLYFTANFTSDVEQLWQYTGSGSPSIVTVAATGPSNPTHLAAVGSFLYLSDDDGSSVPEPWILNLGPAPTVAVTDASGTFTNEPFAATATANGSASLEGVTPTLTYHAGSSVTGTVLAAAPTNVGTYTVVATYPGSIGFVGGSSAHATFTISQATPTLAVTDGGGGATGSPQAASASATGPGGATVNGVFTFTYTDNAGHTSTTPPTAAGNYSVVGKFTSSNPNYTNATAASVSFTIDVSVTKSVAFSSAGANLIISGLGFDTNIANDTVTLSDGTGTVKSATDSTLTVSLSGVSVGQIFAIVHVNGVASTNTQVGWITPALTSSTAAVAANATTITLNGFGFDPTPSQDLVFFSNGVTGTVSAASATQLTVGNLTGLVDGRLYANVKVDGANSGKPVQVAAVAPVVTSAMANILANTTTLTVQGFGFSNVAQNDVVTLSSGATATVASATATQLNLTDVRGLVAGPLSITVEVNNISSATTGVGTVQPVVTSSETEIADDATSLTIHGVGFLPGASKNKVTLNGNAKGTVSYATSTTLVVSNLTGLTAGSLTAVVTSNNVSSGSAVPVAKVG